MAFLNHDELWFPDHLESCPRWGQAHVADVVLARSAILRPAEDPSSVTRPATVIGAGTDGRYDPAFTIALASSIAARREAVAPLRGWQPAAECAAESA